MLRAGIMDISGIANIGTDIADIGTDITDIAIGIIDVVDSADIVDRILRMLRWKQVDAYKVSQECPMTYTVFSLAVVSSP